MRIKSSDVDGPFESVLCCKDFFNEDLIDQDYVTEWWNHFENFFYFPWIFGIFKYFFGFGLAINRSKTMLKPFYIYHNVPVWCFLKQKYYKLKILQLFLINLDWRWIIIYVENGKKLISIRILLFSMLYQNGPTDG